MFDEEKSRRLWDYMTGEMLERLDDRCNELGVSPNEAILLLLLMAIESIAYIAQSRGGSPEDAMKLVVAAGITGLSNVYDLPPGQLEIKIDLAPEKNGEQVN